MAFAQIIVADDEASIRALVADILEEAGYTVEVYGDGLSALTAIRSNLSAVVLLDIAMPVMTGDVVLQQLCAEGHTAPVVVMTAERDPQRFLQLGATDVLPKPFELSELLAVVARACATQPPLREVALGERPFGRRYAPR